MDTYPFGVFVRLKVGYAQTVDSKYKETEENSMADQRKAEEIAVNRHKIIAPIIAAMEEKSDTAKLVLLKKETCIQNGISRRTLGRWLAEYSQHGFEGLKPVARSGIWRRCMSG